MPVTACEGPKYSRPEATTAIVSLLRLIRLREDIRLIAEFLDHLEDAFAGGNRYWSLPGQDVGDRPGRNVGFACDIFDGRHGGEGLWTITISKTF